MHYIIVNTADPSLAWSNEDGWTEDTYDTFTEAERQTLNLPIGGKWEPVAWTVAGE